MNQLVAFGSFHTPNTNAMASFPFFFMYPEHIHSWFII